MLIYNIRDINRIKYWFLIFIFVVVLVFTRILAKTIQIVFIIM